MIVLGCTYHDLTLLAVHATEPSHTKPDAEYVVALH